QTADLRQPRGDDEWKEVERSAEEAASEAVIPETALLTAMHSVATRHPSWDIGRIRILASRFKVTPLAMATRLRTAGVLTWAAYRSWRAEWNEYVAALPPRRGGIASPVDETLGRAARPFDQPVADDLDA